MGNRIYTCITILKYPALYIFFSFVTALIAQFITRSPYELISQYAIAINTTATVITFHYIIKHYRNKDEVQITLSSFKKFSFYHFILGLVSAVLCVIFIDTLLYLLDFYKIFPGQFEIYKQNIKDVFSGKFGLTEIILLSTLIPLFEEFLYRGLLFNQLKIKFKFRNALIIQAIIFGLSHGLPIQIVYGIFIGIVFSAVYIYSGSLWMSVICHMTFNLLNLIQYLINEKNPNHIISTFAIKNAAIILTLIPALLIYILIYYHRSYSKTCNN